MVDVRALDKYTPEIANRVRELLVQLSRSGQDKGEIPAEWFEEIIASKNHDLLLAYDGDRIVGMASLSIVMGPGIRKNAYLEDFVVDAEVRGKGVGRAMWRAMTDWAKSHGAQKLEFTCGQGRENSQKFYERQGAEKYPTNFYRFEIH